MTWEPDRYLQYADERLRPAVDLLARVPLRQPRHIVDLGCGAGNVTRLLAERWPEAQITGLDSSSAMLERARGELPGVLFEQTGVEHWEADEPLDLLFSNAALHWVEDHASLFPRLVEALFPGGVLAVQMPGNFEAPSHRLIREVAALPDFAEATARVRMGAVLAMADYHHLLAPLSTRLSLWETTYWQSFTGTAPVLDWLRGSTLVPYLSAMDEAMRTRFLAELEVRLRAAYPPDAQGTTLFPFRRIFILAQR